MERDTPCRTSHQAAGPDSGRRQCVERNHSHSHPKIYQGGATPEMATADLPLTDSTAFTSLALVFRLHRLQLKLYPIGLQAPKPWHFEKLSTPPPVTNRFNATVNKIHCARFYCGSGGGYILKEGHMKDWPGFRLHSKDSVVLLKYV